MIDIQVVTKHQFSAEDKSQLAYLMQKLDEIEYQLPPMPTEYFVSDIEESPESHRNEIWIIARHSTKIIGYLRSAWNIKTDNLDLGKLQGILVLEEYRRKGIGSKILTKYFQALPSQISKFTCWAVKGTSGQCFFEKILHEKPKLSIRTSVSKIQKLNRNEVFHTSTKLKAESEALGFRFIFIKNAEFSKHVNIRKYVFAYDSLMNDMPMDELTLENEIFTEEKFLERYQIRLDMGYTNYTFVALKGNEIAGMTDSQINNLQPIIAEQLITGVIKPFRGNKLGLTLKYQMLEKLLTETEVEYWVTDNAGSNKHVIRINDLIGYKEWLITHMYEKKLAR